MLLERSDRLKLTGLTFTYTITYIETHAQGVQDWRQL